MTESQQLFQLATLARRSIEPGLQVIAAGTPTSAGACLHASLVVVMLLRRFGRGIPTVRGGADGAGAMDAQGVWRGHYWVEVEMPSGAIFVVDVSADQFGHDPVIVMPRVAAGERYRPGPQAEVDEAFADLASEFGCRDLVAA